MGYTVHNLIYMQHIPTSNLQFDLTHCHRHLNNIEKKKITKSHPSLSPSSASDTTLPPSGLLSPSPSLLPPKPHPPHTPGTYIKLPPFHPNQPPLLPFFPHTHTAPTTLFSTDNRHRLQINSDHHHHHHLLRLRLPLLVPSRVSCF